LFWVLGKPDNAVHPDAIARLIAAEAQAADPSPPLPADRKARQDLAAGPGIDLYRALERLADPEARLNVAAQALGQEIRILRGMTTVPGGVDLPALEDHD
jgi:hypothetical protein